MGTQVSPQFFFHIIDELFLTYEIRKKHFIKQISLKIYDVDFIICRNFFYTANPAQDNNKELPVIIKNH